MDKTDKVGKIDKTAKINKAVLDTPVEGINLKIGTLRDQLGAKPTLLVFLRHFGCIFCRETVADLRRVAEQNPAYPPVLFFYQGNVEQGRAFFRHLWPDAAYVADQPTYFYNAFGLERGSMIQMFGPPVWACGVRATLKGHTAGKIMGDPWQMPGIFLAQGERLLWQHEFTHAADHPNWKHILETMPTYDHRAVPHGPMNAAQRQGTTAR